MKEKTKFSAQLFLAVIVFGFTLMHFRHALSSAESPNNQESIKVMVTYFRGDIRCSTCIDLEAYAAEAVKIGFPEEVSRGVVEFRSINIDELQHRHFIKDYKLFSRAVVVSRIENGKEVKWKNLDMIWHLIVDKEKYLNYIQAETKRMMARPI